MNEDELNALKARLLKDLRQKGQGRCADTVERVWPFIVTAEAFAKQQLERKHEGY